MKTVFLSAAALVAAQVSVPAFAAQLITNGGFETGLTGWTATSSNFAGGGCDQSWTASTSGNAAACQSAPNPFQGTMAAYNSFDGDGPQSVRLSQDIDLGGGVSSATLNWTESYLISFCCDRNPSPTGRSFNILITDITNQTLATLSSENFPWSDGASFSSNGWVSHSLDITSALTGLNGTVRLVFENFENDSYSGPGAFGLDAVSLDAQVPEPAMLGLFGMGAFALGLSRRRKAA